jgi:hypothetical protein
LLLSSASLREVIMVLPCCLCFDSNFNVECNGINAEYKCVNTVYSGVNMDYKGVNMENNGVNMDYKGVNMEATI